jgi:hypothetical protein
VAERGDRFLTATSSARSTRDYVRTFPMVGNVRVGASVLQTPGAIQSEIDKVDGEIGAFDAELEGFAKLHGVVVSPGDWIHGIGTTETYDGKDKIGRFYVDSWVPFRRAWHEWKNGNSSWWHNLWTNEAPTAEAFQQKLLGYRKAARQIGYPVHSPEPDIEGRSIADPRRRSPADIAGDATDMLMKVAKYGLYGALVLGGMLGVVEIVHVARSK